MNGSFALASPRQSIPVVRIVRKLLTRGPAVILRNWRKRGLRADYLRGYSSPARDRTAEETDPAIVDTGRDLRQKLLTGHEGKHAPANYRVLMLQPDSITAEIWFNDLAQCMRHAGIDCRVLPPRSTSVEISATFEMFKPNVFIATESTQSLRVIDLPLLRRFKKEQGCLRLFIPVWHSNSPRWNVPGGRSTPAEDAWRRDLRARGLTADAYFSLFEMEFHERFSHDPLGPPIEYVTVPQACNPFTDYPIAATRLHDYFMATSMTDERVEVSCRYLRPILRSYRGLWAGARWGFGMPEGIPPALMPLRYAQTRIALSPLVGFVHAYAAEVTHRVYAAAGCGAFQLTMPTAITGRYFRPDELVQAASPGEYAHLFAHYVDRPLERNTIALAALRRVYAEHTCFHRVDKLVSHWDDWRRRGMF